MVIEEEQNYEKIVFIENIVEDGWWEDTPSWMRP